MKQRIIVVTSEQRVKQRTGDPVTDVALDTIAQDKQALVFVNTKRSAEACAERISDAINNKLPVGQRPKLSQEIYKVLRSPTKQCERLRDSIIYQAAFHHSGLHSKQRSLVEEAFKDGDIKVICATPTLAAGLDMPAYRVIIRDLKRFSGGWGMKQIPILEYEQMSGRAGRPSYDDEGQSITLANEPEDVDQIKEDYVLADPEPIQSKLAARPILRTYVLSLVATGFVDDLDGLESFMKETFYAKQYGDDRELQRTVRLVKRNLVDWAMLKDKHKETDGFVSAKALEDEDCLQATELGQRVSELYLDPYTANTLVNRLNRVSESTPTFALLHAVCHTLEMRPLIRVKKGDREMIEQAVIEHEDELLCDTPDQFDDDREEFLHSVKTTMVLYDWIHEVSENRLNEKYGVTPGELQAKRSLADWLLYSCDELTSLIDRRDLGEHIRRLRRRVDLGVDDDLLNLTRLDRVGRVRSRTLFDAGIKNVGDVKNTSYEKLKSLLGPKTAASLKQQTGSDIDPESVEEDRHGNLLDYKD